jgi:membrane protease subunit HflK
LGFCVALAIAGYASTGLYIVAPGERAVVRRLGRALPFSQGPGLHLGWPAGIDRVTKVRTDEVRRLRIGLASPAGVGDEPGAGEFLTGDLNLVRAEATVQYRVEDPVRYALGPSPAEPILARLSEACLSRALARQGVDTTLREGRAEVARATSEELERAGRVYGLGVAILGVSLTDARPPSEVAPDFAAAQSARSEHDRRVNEAKTYAASTVTRAGAAAQARIEQARGRSDRTIALARSRATRFLALLAEADRARGLTVRRLYVDALRDILPRVRRKLVMGTDEAVDLSLFGDAQSPASDR